MRGSAEFMQQMPLGSPRGCFRQHTESDLVLEVDYQTHKLYVPTPMASMANSSKNAIIEGKT